MYVFLICLTRNYYYPPKHSLKVSSLWRAFGQSWTSTWTVFVHKLPQQLCTHRDCSASSPAASLVKVILQFRRTLQHQPVQTLWKNLLELLTIFWLVNLGYSGLYFEICPGSWYRVTRFSKYKQYKNKMPGSFEF